MMFFVLQYQSFPPSDFVSVSQNAIFLPTTYIFRVWHKNEHSKGNKEYRANKS
jgi:hypothetical protein